MAYKRSNGKLQRRKMEPAVQTFVVNTPVTAAGANGTYFCDLSQIASILNRRFYRQGINWMVAGMKILSGVSSSVVIRKLPETWVMHNAWTKGFNAWRDMNDKALEANESARPRFLDFKIYADKDHHQAGFNQNLLPISYDYDQFGIGNISVEATPGEWVHSTYHIPNTNVDSSDPTSNNPRSVIAVGGNYLAGAGADGQLAVSLIEGYAASRGLPYPEDPNVPDDAASVNQSLAQNWLTALDNDFDQQEGEVMLDMITENNMAPYPFENDGVHVDTMYPGGANQMNQLQVHDICSITGTTVGSQTYVKGGSFPCGLIRIDHATVDTAGNLAIQIDLVPGNHRGYLCEPMGA